MPAQAAEAASEQNVETAGSAAPITPGEAAEQDPTEPTSGDIVVVATRLRGQVDAPQAPVQVLNEQDIAAYGSASISDLLEQLSPQTGSGRGRSSGRPVILLNGQRISGFREMRNIPPEAIRRMEILPEEVALRFGYPANQRVVNFILKSDFSATTGEIEFAQPDRGGTTTDQAQASLFRTTNLGRLNVSVSATDTTPLTEAERPVAQAPGSLPGSAGARTLVADSRELAVNATWTKGLGEQGLDGALTLNGAYTRDDSTSFSGIDPVIFDPLQRRTQTDTAEAGFAFARTLGDWQLTATADASHAISTSLIDRRTTTVTDTARSVVDSVTSLITAVGRPVHLPAGDVTMTLKSGFAYTGIASTDTRTGAGETRLRRGDLSAGINLGIPIASRRNDVLSGIGDLSVNLSAGVNRLSDFGTITDWSTGLTWGITEKLGFQASYIVNRAAPTLTDLGNPAVQTFNVPVYDFVRGETALVTVTTGGNPLLARETRKDIKLGLNWELPFLQQSNFIVEYFRNSSDNLTAAFPLLTPAIEAAFPGRVTRDDAGRLTAIDRRPVTFANETSSRLRYGFNLSGKLGKPAAGAAGAGRSARAGGDGARGGGGGFGFGPGGRGNGQGRWNASLYHTVQFMDRVTVAAGGPVLDLLNGDAVTAGGVSRHKLEFEGGGFYRGFGLRLNGSWSAPVRLRGSGAPGASDLRFGALTKVNTRLFINLGQQQSLVSRHPFLKGARLSLKVDNLFDSRQRVTDQSGAVPLSYQPDLLDPLGRVIGIELRKQF